MIRFATPVFNKEGVKKNVKFLNFLAQILIDEILNNQSRKEYWDVHVVNSNGYWILSPNEEQNFGFMYKNKKNITFPVYISECLGRDTISKIINKRYNV